MPGRSFVIRFPNGSFELDASRQHPPPSVGDTIRRNGRLWRVTETTDGKPVVVLVEPAEGTSKNLR